MLKLQVYCDTFKTKDLTIDEVDVRDFKIEYGFVGNIIMIEPQICIYTEKLFSIITIVTGHQIFSPMHPIEIMNKIKLSGMNLN